MKGFLGSHNPPFLPYLSGSPQSEEQLFPLQLWRRPNVKNNCDPAHRGYMKLPDVTFSCTAARPALLSETCSPFLSASASFSSASCLVAAAGVM